VKLFWVCKTHSCHCFKIRLVFCKFNNLFFIWK